MTPVFGDPPKNTPPKFPPPCAKFGDFWDPPGPPLFWGFGPGPLDPGSLPPGLMMFFDLKV